MAQEAVKLAPIVVPPVQAAVDAVAATSRVNASSAAADIGDIKSLIDDEFQQMDEKELQANCWFAKAKQSLLKNRQRGDEVVKEMARLCYTRIKGYQVLEGRWPKHRNVSLFLLHGPRYLDATDGAPVPSQPIIVFRLFGITGSVYLTRDGNNCATTSANPQEAEALELVPVESSLSAENFKFGDPCWLRSKKDGKYLERTVAGPFERDPHWACRFTMGFVDAPTQTVSVDQGDSANPLTFSSNVGLRWGGTVGRNESSPQTNNRRYMTLRRGDPPQVVTSWWHDHERVQFHTV